MKIIAFGASTCTTSINQKLAQFAAKQFDGDIEILDLRDYQFPLYSVDVENEIGLPEKATELLHKFQTADLIIISLAEHNGAYTAAFKNTFDWVTRVNMKCFAGKKLFLLATSPGARGGQSVLDIAAARFPFHGGEVITTFSLPAFNDNFSETEGITNAKLAKEFAVEVEKVKAVL
ncbi:NADPH-dependent FMN reductase [Capnocytophaga sp.]|uniref:NADPH-dependent FMN reductase n=1 Tax=Capnocytophaga sp. TaxID=44737 RepID=UPI0026DD07D8|nr:NAD(P)H-dependent oxidoreductase [Capnocytophaga sp.]MDO5104501.1 NAD(P)H-dependent oxidoreductase [Capnocytophaga sp.]MDO5106383.1 NAD(P)H-dependent oxidoreductase [Capnocytophaga sp.]